MPTCEALLRGAGPGLMSCCRQIAVGFRMPDWSPSILWCLSTPHPLNLYNLPLQQVNTRWMRMCSSGTPCFICLPSAPGGGLARMKW